MMTHMSRGAKFALYAFLVIVVIITLIPLLYTLSASFKTNFEIAKGGINLIPRQPTFDNFKTVWGMSGTTLDTRTTYADYTVNSLKVSMMTVVLVVFFTSMSAYCFQRGNFPGRNLLYWLFMCTMFIGAGTITIFPLLQITTKLKINNHLGLALVQFGTAGASNLFLTMGYLKTIPKDLDDSAKIDGCSFFGIWWRIILPLSRPILATIALMAFRASWNNYLIPNLMLAGNQRFTTLVVAVVRLQSMGGAGASQYNLMMAGTMLAMLPMLILFLCMNKMFVEGITQGAVKG
ncbi:MAG: carbohydrate ABC transporter permease [Clostridia bacterium]|nr:carbohydrate ABC transporter permease [Clostridia bacterium]